MHIGKIPPVELKKIVLEKQGAHSDLIELGPAIGEDAAVLRSKSPYQVVASDPVTGAVENIGTIAVHVNANDVAASGADPMFFLSTILLDGNAGYSDLEAIMDDIDAACKEVGAAIVGGHTEITPGIDRTIISGTMIGHADSYVPTGGAKCGDAILLTKCAGIEGAAILSHERRDELQTHFGKAFVGGLQEYSSMLSVVPEARILRKYANAMHDPTEGGVAGALGEIASASSLGISVAEKDVPVPDDIKALCSYYSIDPLNLISSGALIATVPMERAEEALAELESEGHSATQIGTMTDSGCTLSPPPHDALWDIL